MANVTVIGAQWGDEGKGKIIDWLSNRAEMVVRFQGRQQCRPHHRGRRQDLQIVAAALGRGAGQALHHRQWRGGRSLVAAGGNRAGQCGGAERHARCAGAGGEMRCWCCPSTRNWMRCARKPPARSWAPPSAALARPMRTRSGRRALRVIDLKDFASLPVKIERLLAHHNVLRKGFGAAEVDAGALLAALKEIAPKILPLCRFKLARVGRGAAQRQAHIVRGRAGGAAGYRSRHLSFRHLLQHGGRPGGGGIGRGAARHRHGAGHRQKLYHPRSARDRSPPN